MTKSTLNPHRIGVIKLKERYQGTFLDELRRLGASRAGEVLERCSTHGRSWGYVEKALANEQPVAIQTKFVTDWGEGVFTGADDEQIPHLRPLEADLSNLATARVATPWNNGNESEKTVLDAWQAALYQLEMQLDRASFGTWLRGATLIDFEPETTTFVLVARTSMAQKMLEGKLDRLIKRVLGDVYGQPAQVKYLLKDEWMGQGEQIA